MSQTEQAAKLKATLSLERVRSLRRFASALEQINLDDDETFCIAMQYGVGAYHLPKQELAQKLGVGVLLERWYFGSSLPGPEVREKLRQEMISQSRSIADEIAQGLGGIFDRIEVSEEI